MSVVYKNDMLQSAGWVLAPARRFFNKSNLWCQFEFKLIIGQSATLCFLGALWILVETLSQKLFQECYVSQSESPRLYAPLDLYTCADRSNRSLDLFCSSFSWFSCTNSGNVIMTCLPALISGLSEFKVNLHWVVDREFCNHPYMSSVHDNDFGDPASSILLRVYWNRSSDDRGKGRHNTEDENGEECFITLKNSNHYILLQFNIIYLTSSTRM